MQTPLFLEELQGMWIGDGMGKYPPHVGSFQYTEELTVTPIKQGIWEWRSETKSKISETIMHVETGFLRARTTEVNGSTGTAELLLSHPFGLIELEEGTFSETSLDVWTRGEGILRTANSKEPRVCELRRVYEIRRNEEYAGETYLEYKVEMATTTSDIKTHLIGRLTKQKII